jgi:hypothetical protein
MPDGKNHAQIRYVPAASKKTPPARVILRGALVAVWLLILLIPAFFIVMTINGEVTIPLGDAPEQNLRIWLISEARVRGLGVASGGVASRSETDVCVETDLRYLLWQGTQAPSTYCECFMRSGDDGWSFASGWEGLCSERPEGAEASP